MLKLSDKERSKAYYWKSKAEGSTPLGHRLKTERRRRGMSIETLAERVEISISAITGYENRGVDMRASILIRICKALDCTADWLLGLDEE